MWVPNCWSCKKEGKKLKLEHWVGNNLIWNVPTWISFMRLMPGFTWSRVLVRRQKKGKKTCFARSATALAISVTLASISFPSVVLPNSIALRVSILLHNPPSYQWFHFTHPQCSSETKARASGEMLNVVNICDHGEIDVEIKCKQKVYC